MKKTALDKFMTTFFILHADNNMHKETKKDLRTQFALGHDQQPATIEEAVDVIKMQCSDKKKPSNSNNDNNNKNDNSEKEEMQILCKLKAKKQDVVVVVIVSTKPMFVS